MPSLDSSDPPDLEVIGVPLPREALLAMADLPNGTVTFVFALVTCHHSEAMLNVNMRTRRLSESSAGAFFDDDGAGG